MFEWGVEVGLYGNWGGPLVDHFITCLATLLLPIEWVPIVHDNYDDRRSFRNVTYETLD